MDEAEAVRTRKELQEEVRMVVIKIAPSEKGNPLGKLAEAELHFTEGPLSGLKLCGFGIWQSRRAGSPKTVTFPARFYSVNGVRRSFALLRPIADTRGRTRSGSSILAAYAEHEASLAATF